MLILCVGGCGDSGVRVTVHNKSTKLLTNVKVDMADSTGFVAGVQPGQSATFTMAGPDRDTSIGVIVTLGGSAEQHGVEEGYAHHATSACIVDIADAENGGVAITKIDAE